MRLARWAATIVIAMLVGVSMLSVGMMISAEEPTPSAEGLLSSDEAVAPAAPVPGGPGFYAQTALMCQPYFRTAEWAYSGQGLSNSSQLHHTTFMCPVDVPHGATMSKVVVYFYDYSNLSLTVWLKRMPLMSDLGDTVATLQSIGAISSNRHMYSIDLTWPTVDLQSYSYVLEVLLPATDAVRLLSYRIDFHYGAYVPIVTRNSN